MKLSAKTIGYLCLLITSIVWGSTWVVSKNLVATIPPLQMASVRQFIAGVLLLSYFLFFKKMPLPNLQQFLWLIMMAFLCFVFANGVSTLGVKYIPSGLASLIGALYPLSVYLLQSLFFNQRKFNLAILLGLVLGLIGISFVFIESATHNVGSNYLLGIGLSLFAMLSWSLGTIFIARNKLKMNSYYATGWQMFISSFVLLLLSFTVEQPISFGAFTVIDWIQLFYLVIFGSIIAFLAFIYSNKVLSPSIASLYAYINPFVAMIIAFIFLKEPLTINLLWGAAITLIGVYLVNNGLKR